MANGLIRLIKSRFPLPLPLSNFNKGSHKMIAKRAVLILFSIFLAQNLWAEEPLSYLNRILSSTEQSLDKSYRRLATGTYLLPDNPANYILYEKLEANIRELDGTISNYGDMNSYYKTAESFSEHITDLLQNIRELILKRSSFLYSPDEYRDYIDIEINQYYEQILFTLKNAEFNKKRIFAELLADNILKGWFQGEKYYQLSGVDRLLDFFLRQRIIMGTLVKTLESRTRSLALNAENLMAFQKSLWDIDMAKEISRLRKNHLLFIINLLLL